MLTSMAICRLGASNFKSFRQLDAPLQPFQVLIGANAAGKSNFVQIFRLLRDVIQDGLEDAVSQQGGFSYLQNLRLDRSQPARIDLVLDDEHYLPILSRDNQPLGLKIEATEYSLSLCPGPAGALKGLDVKEQLTYRGLWFLDEAARADISSVKQAVERGQYRPPDLDRPLHPIGPGTFTRRRSDGRTEQEMAIPEPHGMWSRLEVLSGASLLQHVPGFVYEKGKLKLFEGGAILDINPKLSKMAIPLAGKSRLSEDGGNLALILNRILSDAGDRRQFLNLLRYVLPHVADVRLDRVGDNLVVNLSETFAADTYVPAAFLSDGTIQLCALIVALYFDARDPLLIEEPDRNIHPRIISRLIEMMRDASRHKQIIVTTHNPEMVRHAGLDSLLLVSRDGDGFSQISRPADREEVRTFLAHEMGVEDLYIQDLLGS
jgi:hypothetical protein